MKFQSKSGLAILFFALSPLLLYAQNYSINEGWTFKTEDTKEQKVSFPHTWNAMDAQDETPGYSRTIGTYTRKLSTPASYAGKVVYLQFEGANQITEVFLDEKRVGKHQGGYTRFNFDLTPYLRPGRTQELRIVVDNRHHVDIAPLSADFTFFGGIYRDVYLDVREDLHISPLDFASSGVYVKTPKVSTSEAILEISTLINNHSSEKKEIQVLHTLKDPDGKVITSLTLKVDPEANTSNQRVEGKIQVPKPRLWTPGTPFLYTVETKILEKGQLRDECTTKTGFRWFEFHADTGFHLNGKPLKLIGTSRHQDFKDKGYALEDAHHIRDIELLKNMGGNFLRIAHYPQDPLILEMCDKLGILASVEIPIVNAVTESAAFSNQSIFMAEEMVKQNTNHPSLIVWSYMNEVMLRPPYKNTEAAYGPYCQEVYKQAKAIQDKIKQLDPSRPTMIAFHGNVKAYEDANLFTVPDIIGWNLYQGWYSDRPEQLDTFLKKYREKYPSKPTILSEYGADVDVRIHTYSPERFDYSVEYGDLYHEHYLKTILNSPFLAGAAIWNLNDFYSEVRKNTIPHVNSKGISGLDRKPKNTYFLYQAHLLKQAFVRFASKEWQQRPEGNHEIKIYSNASQVTLYLNNKKWGKLKVNAGIAKTHLNLPAGTHTLRAHISGAEDSFEIHTLPSQNFNELNVALGSKRFFWDENTKTLWQPEKAYEPGSYGFIGGQALRPKTRYGELPTAEVRIKGTDLSPLFLTQRIGIEKFKADLPAGKYAVYLYWAELNGTEPADAIAYNLGNDAIQELAGKRSFNVKANGVSFLENYEIDKEAGIQQAAVKKFNIDVKENGLTIEFIPIEGTTLLNAIKIIKRD
ncbi:Beta-galactosidase [Leadbetterella byssophila DSM 17132]|uniref:Beta-galactosidase n=1 Tax=Leadbetterella byssophila (strain DSM 17132 / JCM 16389 / KACC 11308 / NBRC 106382 / 4M15) TaxID=649349 RepID=E4RVE4_LEAB4|nr:glycoside hydrolase family 2 TIM barrel-domain containing protein [Leadbetterella byssophila]ADQ16130.1 Beta-galactosidase [Leadbetterella byssophila DSM 17132]